MGDALNNVPAGAPTTPATAPMPPATDPMMGGQQMPPATDPMNGGIPPAQDPMGGGMTTGTDPMAGSQQNGFDMGIGMTPDEDPKKFIEGGVAKIASELRKYQGGMPKPDMELNKTAVNTIAAATKTGLQPNQTDELMTSYADTMRKDDNGGDNSNGDFPTDTDNEQQDNGEGDMNVDTDTVNDMGQDNMEQTPLQEAVNKAINELFRDINVDKRKTNKDDIQFQDSRNSFTRKPFMPPIK